MILPTRHQDSAATLAGMPEDIATIRHRGIDRHLVFGGFQRMLNDLPRQT